LTGNSSRSIESTDPSIPRPRHRADSTALAVKRLGPPRFNGRPQVLGGRSTRALVFRKAGNTVLKLCIYLPGVERPGVASDFVS
jgi:hypothetical protein